MPIRNVAKRATTIERWLSSKWHQRRRLGRLAFPVGRRLNRADDPHPRFVDRLRAMRGPGESYSHVIPQLVTASS